MENKKYEKLIKKLGAVYNNGNYQKAINLSNKLLKAKDNDNLAIYNLKSTALSNLGRYDEAIDTLDEALKIYPNNPALISNKATFLIAIDEEKALIELDKVLELLGEDNDEIRVSTLYNKASVLKNDCQYEESLKSFNELLKISPDDLPSLEDKVDVLIKLKEYDEGIKTCDKILNLDSSNMKAIINKSGMLNSIGETQRSNETLEKLRYFGYSKNIITLNKGIILMNNENYEESLDCFNQLLRENNQDFQALHYLGRVYNEMGDYETSLKYYDKILDNSKNPEFVFNTYYHKGLVLNKLERYAEALEIFNMIPDDLKEFKDIMADDVKETLDNLNNSKN